METQVYKYLRFVHFKNVEKWYVSYYLNTYQISSSYNLEKLGDLITPLKNKIKKSEYKGNLKIVKKISFFDGKIHLRDSNVTNMDLYFMPRRQLLVSNINFHQGAIAITGDEDLVCTTHYQPYLINQNKINGIYLVLSLRCNLFQKYLSNIRANGIKNESNFNFIKTLQIPLPSIEEQNALVLAYNSKMAQAEALEKQAIETETNIEEYLLEVLGISSTVDKNYSITKKGVSVVQEPQIEYVVNLQTNQLDDKIYHWGDEIKKEYNFLKFVNFKDLERWDMYNTQSATDKSILYPCMKLSNLVIAKPKYGANYSAIPYNGEVRYIRITDINEDGSLNNDSVSANDFNSKYLLNDGDFLIARSGNTVGKTFLYKSELGKAIYAGYLIKFEINTNKILNDYLLVYTKSSIYKKWINSNMRVSAQPNINSQQFLNSPIIVPPLDIQNEIVKHISAEKEKIKNLKAEAENLRKSALVEFENEIFA